MHSGAFALLLLPLCFCVQLEWVAAGVGVNYGTSVASESAEGLVQFLRSRGIGKIRLQDADSAMLRAIGTSSREAPIDVIVGVTNDEIVDMGVSPASAHSWITRNVVPYLPATNIIAIAVGSEVLTVRQADDQSVIVPFLVPAMRNLYAALSEVGLEQQIKVSAPQSTRVLSTHFPPSSATFNGGIITDSSVAPLLDFLASSGSYFMLNLYPQDLQDDGVTGPRSPAEDFSAARGIVDRQTGRQYSSMVDVLTDAVAVAMTSLGHHQLSVIGIEMEWSRTRASNVFRTRRTLGGLAVGIDSRLGEHLVTNPPQVEKNVFRAEAFSSRRFLVDPLQAKQPEESGKRRRLANKSWCVAKSDASTTDLQSALDWACGPGGADCQPLQLGQSCFLPNTILAHASFAFNSYYQKQNWASGSCDFQGLAQTTTDDPSSTSCLYTSSTSADGTPSTPTGSTVPISVAPSSRLTWDRCRFILTSCILIFLVKRTLPDLV